MILVATQSEVLALDSGAGALRAMDGLEDVRPTCLAADPQNAGRAWCGTDGNGVFRCDDGVSWLPSGMDGRRIMSLAASPAEPDVVWAGTEPSEVWRSGDGGGSWQRTSTLGSLPSSSQWAFPPRPETHHVRWIACQPDRPDRLWVAIEAGALISTVDGGATWRDRVSDGPYDTHELAIHPGAPERLHVAAGDGYYESPDGGDTWQQQRDGLEIRYLRSVAIDPGDPDVVLVSGASGARSAYVAGRSDGRLYRRAGRDRWKRVTDGWPESPSTIAPLLLAGEVEGELWAADERGLHRTVDGGVSWAEVAAFPVTPNNLRGVALLS